MNKKTLIAVTFCLTFSLSMSIPVNAIGAPPALASYDWSVKSAHNLASKPPSLAAVQAFEHAALGAANELGGDKVCEFRFADLRGSGNLSLIVTVNGGGTGGCNLLYVFDKAATGFELYSPDGAVGDDLAKSVLDINHDGKDELVLWGYLAPTATNELGCEADWPLIFAWNGSTYAEASSQYKGYYERYLDSLNKQMATKYSRVKEVSAPAPARPEDSPSIAHPAHSVEIEVPGNSMGGGFGFGSVGPAVPRAPSQGVQSGVTSDSDYACQKIEAAKTEAFVGIDPETTMSAAIKDSESADPDKRILAAVIFSYIGSQEATQDLRSLSNDSDSRVADIAKRRLSYAQDPSEDFRTISREPVFGENRAPYYLKLSEPRQRKQ